MNPTPREDVRMWRPRDSRRLLMMHGTTSSYRHLSVQASAERRMIEVQVKTTTSGTWPLGSKGTVGALTDREWYVFVLLGRFPERPRTWVVPRDHVAAATWIAHMSWLTDPTANPGSRNAGIRSARLPRS